PEVIVVASHTDTMHRASKVELGDLWRSTPAVRANRIVLVPGDTLHRFGPRVVDGLGHLAQAIHPEVFAQPGIR
ncbi:MAG: ABC transporter substrate-binding protein, partial [Gemmatimonadales bacterium]